MMLLFSAGHIVFIIIVIGSGQCYKDSAPSFQYIPLRNANLSFSHPLNDFGNAAHNSKPVIRLTHRAKKAALKIHLPRTRAYKAHNGKKREKRQTQGAAAAINFFLGHCQ